MKYSYLPKSDSARSIWLKSFAGKISFYAALLGLSIAEIDAIVADSAAYTHLLDYVDRTKKESKKLVNYKNQLADGTIGSTVGLIPAISSMPEAPDAVPAGIFRRIGKLVQRIKNHPSYTESIGEDLGIVGPEVIVRTKPKLTITLNAERPVIKWIKGNNESIDIYVDRNDGKGFHFLVTATSTPYIDTYELPSEIHSVTWQYKGIYKKGNKQTGELSDIVNITLLRSIA